jgi:hypothetical protein
VSQPLDGVIYVARRSCGPRSRSRPTRTTDASTSKGNAKISWRLPDNRPHALKKSGRATLTGMLANLACALGGGLPLLGGPRRPQRNARVTIIPQIRDKVKYPPAPSAAPSGAVLVAGMFGSDEQMFGAE